MFGCKVSAIDLAACRSLSPSQVESPPEFFEQFYQFCKGHQLLPTSSSLYQKEISPA